MLLRASDADYITHWGWSLVGVYAHWGSEPGRVVCDGTWA